MAQAATAVLLPPTQTDKGSEKLKERVCAYTHVEPNKNLNQRAVNANANNAEREKCLRLHNFFRCTAK